MSAGVDGGTCLPYLLGSGGRLWWWTVHSCAVKNEGGNIIHVFLHIYMSEIE